MMVTAYKIEILKQYLRRIGLDLLLIPVAFYLAWLIRFDLHVPTEEWQILIDYLALIIFVYIAINMAFGVYRHLWAYASFRDVILLSETVGLSTLLLLLANFALTYIYGYRLSTGGLIIGGILTLTLSTIVKYRRQLITIFFVSWLRSPGSNPERVLIVGINETAQQLATQIYLGKGTAAYELVGFVSDKPQDHGLNINGVKILGAFAQIPTLVSDKKIDLITIAQRPNNREEMWQLIDTCRKTSAQLKVLPDIFEVIEGCYEDPLALREVSIEDILDRKPAILDSRRCKHILADKVVLVTGAAGSIGSELCQQILRFQPRLLLALDNNESGLYELELELNLKRKVPLQVIMANVGDWHRVNNIFQQYKPQIVFHAAAYKHVPLVEYYPEEALKVNIMGTVIISEAAHQHQAERFVFISTDKAVNPSSLMGASKHIGELWIQSMAEPCKTIFTTVRFGNVIGSRGSVLPTFTRQIELGGPITVTHPKMCRFFISIPEAVSLVLESATFDQSGQIFMLDMGKEVSILGLAERMIRLKGLRVNKDITVKFVGIRPGEKLHEELAYDYEVKEKTPHPHIYRLRSHDKPIDRDTLLDAISILGDILQMPGGTERVRQGIFQIAAGDIDGFLSSMAGLDLTRDVRQLATNIPPQTKISDRL